MPLIQETKFKRKNEKKTRDSITVPLDSLFSREELEACKPILNQTRDTTALKQLARIGAFVIHDKKMKVILDIVIHNKRKNKRSGIIDYEQM